MKNLFYRIMNYLFGYKEPHKVRQFKAEIVDE